MQTFYSHGKLLITGEYLVLDGALSLALPTKYGQSLLIEPSKDKIIAWQSIDHKKNIWFKEVFTLENIKNNSIQSKNVISNRLLQILNAAKKLNPEFLDLNYGYKVKSQLEFAQNWGLGSSSTLINNIANWAKVDPYKLLELTFGGSGYDIACAQNDSAVTYKLNSKTPIVNSINFNPPFKNHLYFVFLNRKQNSRDGIAKYKLNTSDLNVEIKTINKITNAMIGCKSLSEFSRLMDEHENIISSVINQKTVKSSHFSDFKGSIKSLGAWGGDFVLVTSETNPTEYFKYKGFETVIEYKNMLLN